MATVAENRKRTCEAQSGSLTDMISILETLRDEVRDAYDNMPENLQGSERGERLSENADTLDNIISNLEDAQNDLDGLEF